MSAARVFSAAEIIDALRRRRQLKSIRPEVPGQLPPGWQAWLATMPKRMGAVTGASADAIIACLLQRPLRSPPLAGSDLNRWQAFATVWRQQWHPASEDERWVRVTAAVGSLLVHLVLTVMLAWLMYLRLFILPAPTESSVVKVQYIGEGTPESLQVPVPSPRETTVEPVSSVQDTPVPEAPVSAMPAPASVAIEPTPVVAIPMPEMVAPSPPEPVLEIVQPATPVVEQPLLVTEVAQPDIEFVLVEPTPPTLELTQPSLAVPELTMPVAQVEPAEINPDQNVSLPPISVPEAVAQPPVPLPLPLPQQPQRATPRPVDIVRAPLEIPDIASQPMQKLPQLTLPDVQPPSPAPAVEPAASPPPATVTSNAEPVVDDAEQRTPQSSSTEAAAQAPAAPAQSVQSPPPGAWPTPTRGDDWGEALTARPGNPTEQPPGLFDEDGRPRLANNGNKPVQGAAPGTAEQQAIDLDRAGTWLKKSGYSYTPTRFDRYWLPSGTLLEEWVRQGIRNLSIPIPGTSKHLDCVISILQLGGGCTITDPDLNDHPATARPPPDIPFKPELQENQESLRQPQDQSGDSGH